MTGRGDRRGGGFYALAAFFAVFVLFLYGPMVAIITLSFSKWRDGRPGGRMLLADVPSVLLSECWNDYRDMAAKGGFDKDWERKVAW